MNARYADGSDPTVNLCVKVLVCGGYGGGVVCGRPHSVTVIFKVGEKGKLYRDSESEGRISENKGDVT